MTREPWLDVQLNAAMIEAGGSLLGSSNALQMLAILEFDMIHFQVVLLAKNKGGEDERCVFVYLCCDGDGDSWDHFWPFFGAAQN